MELLDGEDLGKRLERVGRMPPSELHFIIAQVCRALAKAQPLGIIHRDLKPENIFLVRDDDREIAKVLVAGELMADAANEAQRIAKEFPSFPWLRDQAPDAWRRLPDDEPLTICDPDEPVTRTAREWVGSRGPGLLAVPDFTTGQPGPFRGPAWLRARVP